MSTIFFKKWWTKLSKKQKQMAKTIKRNKEVISKSEMMLVKDAVTNEMTTAKVTMIIQKDTPKYAKNETFTILFQASTLAIGREISPSASKLLLNLCGFVQYGNVIGKTVDELAEHLKYSTKQIRRALDELVELKVLIKSQHPVDKRSLQYHINAYQSWKGNVKDRKKYIASIDPNQLKMFQDTPKALQVNKDF